MTCCKKPGCRIHKVRHTYRPGEPVLPWIYAIARHVRVDHYRKTLRTAAHEQRLEELPEMAAAIPEPSGRTRRSESASGTPSREPARGN